MVKRAQQGLRAGQSGAPTIPVQLRLHAAPPARDFRDADVGSPLAYSDGQRVVRHKLHYMMGYLDKNLDLAAEALQEISRIAKF